MASNSVNGVTASKAGDIVFDMETGATTGVMKSTTIETIAEGSDDEQ